MYLKSLQLQGFKSFADKTRLEFNDGITAVVGPNGSGKSNISDAVRWVLGEQSAKTLRGSKMEDVIFTGTQHRKQQGFAEVSIMMDNSDKALPVDYSEVVITRRVFRSGESEYLINDNICRLKDVYELFLDSGVGRDSYSIIGQGKIDSILSSKSEERRSVFEEASGIMKYKVRKIEAERKLEKTEQNLLRISDILHELEIQIEPLREQSEKAKTFLDLSEKLKTVEVNVFLHNIEKNKERIKQFDEMLVTQRAEIQMLKDKLDNITEESKEKTDKLKQYETEINNYTQQFYNNEAAVERKKADLKINDQKSLNIQSNIERLELEISVLSSSLGQLDTDKQQTKTRLEYLNKELEKFNQKLGIVESEYKSMVEKLSSDEAVIEAKKAEIIDKMELLSEIKFESSNAQIQVQNMSRREIEIDDEVRQNILEIEKEGMQKEDVEDKLFESKKQLNKTNDELNSLVNESSMTNKKLDESKKMLEQQQTSLNIKTSKLKLLKSMDNNLDGYKRSVKEIIGKKRLDKSFGAGVHGALAQLISVPSDKQIAIEAALGNTMQNVVVNTEHDAKECIEYLKAKSIGRCTFLPISTVKEKYLDNDIIQRINKCAGFLSVANEVVSCDKQFSEIIGSVLGRIAVFDSYDNAVAAFRKFNYKIKIVTLSGELFNPGGAISGGIESRETGLISRTGEIADLEKEISSLEISIKNLSSEISTVTKQIENSKSIHADLIERQKNVELEILRDTAHLQQINQIIDKIKAKNELLNVEKGEISTKTEQSQTVSDQFQVKISAVEGQIETIKNEVAELQTSLKGYSEKRETFYSEITDLKLSINSIEESINNVNDRNQEADGKKQNINLEIEQKQKMLVQQNEFLVQLSDGNQSVSEEIKSIFEINAQIKSEIEAKAALKTEFENTMTETIEKINSINQDIMLIQDDINKIEIRKSKFDADLENIHTKLWEEYELTESTATSLKKDVQSLADEQKRVNSFKNQIKQLGSINVASIEDYINTKERFDFMTTQSNDLIETKKKLNKIIFEMVQIMQSQFIDQFTAINKNFNEVFTELFNGGRAEIKLLDDGDILDCGIDIIVQPPGKKLQNMMLLSGGEKALTAIALMFAILKNKPTPFCILDEIEAALDEANVQRFGEYLKNFSDDTQFIVVTHRKGTMEIADTLYGVTMQEHGISNVVSLKLNQ